MYQIDFHHPIHIYFIGIGGISMSGLAEILLDEGFTVSGSDMRPSPLTELLEKEVPISTMANGAKICQVIWILLFIPAPSIRIIRKCRQLQRFLFLFSQEQSSLVK